MFEGGCGHCLKERCEEASPGNRKVKKVGGPPAC